MVKMMKSFSGGSLAPWYSLVVELKLIAMPSLLIDVDLKNANVRILGLEENQMTLRLF